MNGEGEAEVSNINKRIPSLLLLRLLLISIGIVLLEWSDKAKCFWSQRFLNRLEIPFVLVKGPLTEQPPPTGPPPPPSSSLSHLIARHALNLSASRCRAPLKKEAGVKKLPVCPSQHCTDLMLPNTVSILEFIQKVEKGHKYLNFREYSWVWAYTSVTARCKMLPRHRRVQPLMNLMYDGLLIGSGYSICLGTRADTMQHRWCDGTERLIQPHRHICYVGICLWPNSSKMYKSTWWLHKSISYLVTQLLCVFSCTLDTQWSAAEVFLIFT